MADVWHEIREVTPGEEFRVCPACGYKLGFHTSLLRAEDGFRVVLICPECGARYDPGWTVPDGQGA